jgi:hypothetical protein
LSRTIVIGDVHACARELGELLEHLGADESDELLLVGDLVVRGLYPGETMLMVRSLDARAVRGNHEARLLRWHRIDLAGGPKSAADKKLYESQWLARTARALVDEDWRYLEAAPLWLNTQVLRVIHAGLDPALPIEAQDERVLLTCRTLDEHGKPSDRREGVLWGERYVGPPHVVFGHNAQTEPQLHPWATGLDTGCVYGGKLTALVLDEGEPVPPIPDRTRRLVSVAAHDAYYVP